MYWLRACPHCYGDLHTEWHLGGVYLACIQCGYILTGKEKERLSVTRRLEREQASPAGEDGLTRCR